MATDIILPKLGFSMTEADLVEWFVEDGGAVQEGSPLYAIESDKSVQEIDAPVSGTLRILKPTGDSYDVGTVLAQIV